MGKYEKKGKVMMRHQTDGLKENEFPNLKKKQKKNRMYTTQSQHQPKLICEYRLYLTAKNAFRNLLTSNTSSQVGSILWKVILRETQTVAAGPFWCNKK